MQTIEEYKAYTQQLEGEVSKWLNGFKPKPPKKEKDKRTERK